MALNHILGLLIALQRNHASRDLATTTDLRGLLPSPPILGDNSQTVACFVDSEVYVRLERRSRRRLSWKNVESCESLSGKVEEGMRARGEKNAMKDWGENRLKWAGGSR
jgi:hypothetical protein